MGAGAGALHPQKQARVESALVSGGLRASRPRAALAASSGPVRSGAHASLSVRLLLFSCYYRTNSKTAMDRLGRCLALSAIDRRLLRRSDGRDFRQSEVEKEIPCG